MILGSEIAPFVDYVFASEFMDGKHVNSGQTTIQYIAKALGPTEKADVFFRINKGQYIDKLIDHDDRMPHDQRPVPFPNMMFLLDGFTDRRACALLFDRGSYNIAVHDPNSEKSKKTVTKLFENRRVHTYAPANYCKGSALSVIIDARIMQVGERLVR